MSSNKSVKPSGVNAIRDTFLNYFIKHGHEAVASGPLVPRNDPTLMFTNAGMVPFKNIFTGQEKRPYNRAVTSQKCVRAGGKHNDLDNVGYTARHHTFFEMLGNFSFGDYFKEEAIEFAWNLITKDYDIDPNRLLVTVYAQDEEAFSIWQRLTGFSDSKIIKIATNDNFWSMGETGPCGPCSEIFFDHGAKIPGGPPGSKDEDGDRFIEIWNLVFMQYEQIAPDKRIDLPRPSIDTGMGLERISAVLQGTHDNYQTDLFQALIKASVTASNVEASGKALTSHKVIADHLRASSFLICDGVLPSNEGRGYVLRRIMRRAMRHIHLLGVQDPMMYKLVPSLIQQMGDAFPELIATQSLITETLKLEESRFRTTLAKGLGLLEGASKNLVKGDVMAGEIAFKLYDTYGFPLDLTQDALRSRGISVAKDGFDAAMEKQKADARAAWKGSGDTATEAIWFELHQQHGATEFLGYETQQAEGQIISLIKDNTIVTSVSAGDKAYCITNQTPFYGESGGQVGDMGVINGPDKQLFRVTDTIKKLGDLFVHCGVVKTGSFTVGQPVGLIVDREQRQCIKANHSATHILHEALRQVLGSHVAQKGSLVSSDRLRFDFSHPKPLTTDELSQVEKIANNIIWQNTPVETHLMAVDEAIEAGAKALFGEKYGDEVRVVSMGRPLPEEHNNKNATNAKTSPLTSAWSIELCGGTHVNRTGDIGLTRLISESASSAGVRRLEALTGRGAVNYLTQCDEQIRDAAHLLKTKPDQVPDRLYSLVKQRKKLERQLNDTKRQLAMTSPQPVDSDTPADTPDKQASAAKTIRVAGKLRLMARTVIGIQPKDLRGLVDDGKKQIGSGVIAFITITDDGKAGLVVGVTNDLKGSINAVDLVRIGAKTLGGSGGGGRPDMAQAGGPNANQAAAALDAIEGYLAALD